MIEVKIIFMLLYTESNFLYNTYLRFHTFLICPGRQDTEIKDDSRFLNTYS